MQPKVILSPAWAEQEGMSVSDIASLLGYDLASAVPAGGADDSCPRCRNHPPDSKFQFFDDESAMSTPERVPGRGYVRCLCGTDYHYASVHEVDVHQPPGRSHVRAASASKPTVATAGGAADVVRITSRFATGGGTTGGAAGVQTTMITPHTGSLGLSGGQPGLV